MSSSTVAVPSKDAGGSPFNSKFFDDGSGSIGPVVAVDSGNNIATGHVSVGTTATLICAARSGRTSVVILNEGTTEVRLGAIGVTTATGVLLYGAKGSGISLDGGAAIYGVVASGTQTVSFVECY